MKYLIVLSLIIVFIFFGNELGYTKSSPLYTHITYIFQHASFMHLAFNSLSFIAIFTYLERFVERWLFLIISLIFASINSFITMFDKPTVGISGLIYVMIGIYIGVTLFCNKVKITNRQSYMIFLLVILFGLLVSWFHENSNFNLHLYCIISGLISSIPIIYVKNRY